MTLYIGLAAILVTFGLWTLWWHLLADWADRRAHRRRVAYERLKDELLHGVLEAKRDVQSSLMELAHELRQDETGEGWKQ